MNDKIESQININAPIATVWKVVTNLGQWFGDSAELDLREGAKGQVKWEQYGECPLEVVKIDEPRLFSFAWIGPDEETRGPGQRTLVEFELAEDGKDTKLSLTETVYGEQLFSEEQKKSLFSKRTSGWGFFAKRIKTQAEEA